MSARAKRENQAPFIDRGEPLPRSYAENRLVALVREPEMVFVYWDVATEVRVAGNPVILRVHVILDGAHYDLPAAPESGTMYLHLTANALYRFELFERRNSGELHRLAVSAEVATPIRWALSHGAEAPVEIRHAARRPLTRRAPAAAPDSAVAARPRKSAPGAAAPAAPAPVPVPAHERTTGFAYVRSS